MEEKKLTDEEIVKAFEICHNVAGFKAPNCAECPYVKKGIDCIGTNITKDLLDVTKRLQVENERLTREVDKQKNFVTAWEESWKIANEQNTKIRVELKKENAELQKQVDELKEELKKAYITERANIQAEIAEAGTSCHWCEQQTVKDTAKEILGFILAKEFEKGDYLTDDELKKLFEEKYGVEVE
jgi:hypothetical protein